MKNVGFAPKRADLLRIANMCNIASMLQYVISVYSHCFAHAYFGYIGEFAALKSKYGCFKTVTCGIR